MEQKFSIICNGSCDLPEEIIRQKDIRIVHFLVSFNGTDYLKEGAELKLPDFYQRMVDFPCVYPKMAAPSPEDFYRIFEEKARLGQDIFCVCISSKLSSCIQSAKIARGMLSETYPDTQVVVLDSMAATLMQGIFVLELCRLRDSGLSVLQAEACMKNLIPSARIFFTVDTLDHLEHGGRIGKVAKTAGSLLNVKPLITFYDGEIHSAGIKRGRRSLESLCDLCIQYFKDHQCTPKECSLIIGYGHEKQEDQLLHDMLLQKLSSSFDQIDPLPVCQIGATIGVHTGPTPIGIGVIKKAVFENRLSNNAISTGGRKIPLSIRLPFYVTAQGRRQ